MAFTVVAPGEEGYPGLRLYPGLPATPVEYDTAFYVGPLGGLMPLPGVESGVDTPLSVIGGTHTSLTEAFTRDRFGYKRAWVWTYPMLTDRQALFVEALQRNMVPGPLFLLDPRRRNRLPEQIASGGSLMRTPGGFIGSNTTTCVWRPLGATAASASTLPPAPILRGCLEWQLLAAGGASLELAGWAADGRHNIPVLPTEPIEVSLWATGPPQATVSITISVFDDTGNVIATQVAPGVQMNLTSWQVVAAGFVCPDRAAYLRISLSASSDTPIGSIYTTAYQVAHYNPTYVPHLIEHCASYDFGGWWLGGGAPQVIPDIGSTSYVRAGLQSSALTLIER